MEPAQGTLTFDALFYSDPCEVDIWEPLKPTLGVEVRFHYVAGLPPRYEAVTLEARQDPVNVGSSRSHDPRQKSRLAGG